MSRERQRPRAPRAPRHQDLFEQKGSVSNRTLAAFARELAQLAAKEKEEKEEHSEDA